MPMKLVAQIQLDPDTKQREALKDTLQTTNAACNYLSQVAWEIQTFGAYALQKHAYYQVRDQFGLSAQMTIRCLSKVADAYKLDHDTPRTFRPHGAIGYDDRILRWFDHRQTVSIWTVQGRQMIQYRAGPRQQELLAYRQGESKLVCYNGMWFLYAVCEVPEPDPLPVEKALGVDLGVTNIAVTNDGDRYTSVAIERNRQRMTELRADLQSRGTLSAKRHLRKLAGRQRRFQKDINHQISKRLVAQAKRTQRAIALEELTHIRTRTRVRGREQRARHSNWAFRQLRDFINYKSKLAGIPVVIVDPRYTSQQCARCGHTEQANRRSQSEFLCCACGYTAHADVNAAKNIAARAEVILPIVSDTVPAVVPETSPRLQA